MEGLHSSASGTCVRYDIFNFNVEMLAIDWHGLAGSVYIFNRVDWLVSFEILDGHG